VPHAVAWATSSLALLGNLRNHLLGLGEYPNEVFVSLIEQHLGAEPCPRCLEKPNDSPTDEAVPFERLKYYFWHYLDRETRRAVLIELGIMPVATTHELPMNVELFLLQNVQREGKLRALWDAVMEHMPADRREPNPFANSGEMPKRDKP
jgi:hypothetical protein